MKGFYKIDSIRNGIISNKVPLSKNIVLSAGLDRLGVGGAVTRCCLGSGTSEPEATDLSLDSQIAEVAILSAISYPITESPYGTITTFTFNFQPPVVDTVISELGLGWEDGLFTRALVVDFFGNPTSLIWLNDEQLTVTYYISFGTVLDAIFFDIEISGSAFDIIALPSRVQDLSFNYAEVQHFTQSYFYTGGELGDVLEEPTGEKHLLTLDTVHPYISGSNYLTATFIIPATPQVFNITAFQINSTAGNMQYLLSPVINKLNGNEMFLTFSTPIWGVR